MLKVTSALASAKPFVSAHLKIAESPDFTFTQYSGSDKELKKALGKLPAFGFVQNDLLRISPTQIFKLNRHSRESENLAGVHVTELSSSRTRIEISGAAARDVLTKCAAIDFHAREFKPAQFVLTGIHHVAVLIHCVHDDTFQIYVMRTFARAIFGHITDAALEYA